MATLTVTFTRAFQSAFTDQLGGLAVGADTRSEVVTLPGETTLVAGDSENAVELMASDNCWVAIGPDPDATADSAGTRRARYLVAGVPYQYYISPGDKVAAEV